MVSAALLSPVNIVLDIALVIISATILAYIFRQFKQPLIPAYVIAGVILGPLGFQLIKNHDLIFGLSEIGIAFLLFFVGMEMDFRKLKEISFFATAGTLLQVLLVFLAGYFTGIWLGFSNTVALFLGIIVSFSSTSVVMKILSDKEKIDTLHGRIVTGVLIMQDIIIILLLSAFATVGNFSVNVLLLSILKGIVFFVVAIFLAAKVFPKLFDTAARSQELLFLLALTICFLFIGVAHYLGYSIAVGAFIAGLALATLPYNLNIVGQVAPLKDFFATIFFVSLGLQLEGLSIMRYALPLIAFLFLIIILKPLIVMVLCSIFGFEKRTSFLSSASLGQVSEFSLIIALLAFQAGLIAKSIFSFTVLLTVITITMTSYVLERESKFYSKLSRFLGFFEKLAIKKRNDTGYDKKENPNVVIFGGHRMGGIFLKHFLKTSKKKLLVVDYDPSIIKILAKKKIPCLYGDINNPEILKDAKLGKAKIVLSTVREIEENLFLIKHLKKIRSPAKVIVVAEHLHHALDLYDARADYVIIPHIFTAEKVMSIFSKIQSSKKSLRRLRHNHIKHLLSLDHPSSGLKSLMK